MRGKNHIMTSIQYFSHSQPLMSLDVSKISLAQTVPGKSNIATVSYDRVPIMYSSKGSMSTLSFEIRGTGKIHMNSMDQNKSYSLILRTTNVSNNPTDEERARIDKLNEIEAKIQDLVETAKIPLRGSKGTRARHVDPSILRILRTKETDTDPNPDPVLFAKIYSDQTGKISMGENFRRLLSKEEYRLQGGSCHVMADPDMYVGKWMDIVVVIKVTGIFVGNIQTIQIRLSDALIVQTMTHAPVINDAAMALMPDTAPEAAPTSPEVVADDPETGTSTYDYEDDDDNDGTISVRRC